MDIFIYKVPGVRQQLHPADGYLSFFPHLPFITSSHRCLLHSPAQRSSSPPPALLPSPWGRWVCTHEQWETRKPVERDRKKKWIPSLASRTAAAVNRKWLFVSPPSSQRLLTCSCHPHISSKTHTGCRVRMGLTPGTFSSCLPLRSGAVLSTWEVTASIQHGKNPSGDFIRQRIQHRH